MCPRKSLLPLLVILVAFCGTPLVAESPSDSELVAAGFSLREPVEPVESMATCYVFEDCDLGGYVHCYGTTCSAGPEWVKCDGVRTWCPCQASLTCPGGGPTISCQTTAGRLRDCEVGPTWVSCNERITYCPVVCTASTNCGSFSISCQGRIPGSCTSKPGFWVQCDGIQHNCTDL